MEILYERNDVDFKRGTFRVRGDVIEVFPTYDDNAYRIELFGDEMDSLSQIDPLFGTVKQKIHAPAHLSQKPLRRVIGPPRTMPSIPFWKSWPGGKESWRRKAGWWSHSGCTSAPGLTWR